MSLRIYRIILFILAFWFALWIPSILLPWSFHPETAPPQIVRGFSFVAGFAAVPIAAVGLWSERTWGLWLLVIACVITTLAAVPTDPRKIGVFVGIHFVLLAATLLRRFFPSNPLT